MYPVSQDYIDKILSASVKRRRIRGTIDGVAFTENDVLAASFKYSDIAVSSSDIKLGGVFVGQLNLTFLSSFASGITRGTWRKKVINLTIGLRLGEDVWEDVHLKPYIIDDANYSALGVDVKAYDNMAKFDKNIHIDASSGTLYEFALLACNACRVTLGLTRSQMEALPNGTETFSLYPNNDIKTWRDLISWIAVTCCCFATIARDGSLVFKTWGDTPVIEIDKFNRFAGGTWSDFETYYTGLSIVNMEDEKTEYYGMQTDDGLTMNLGSNPLMQYGTNEVKTRQRMAILTALQNLRYVPFKSNSLIDPCLDLGDVISYVGGIADEESICCVMRIDFSYSKGVTLQGYGKNPALIGAQSKTDKDLSGLMSKTSENEIITHTFINAAQIDLGEDIETSILNIKFATINPTVVTLLHEIILDVEATSQDDIVSCQVLYYLNDDLISYSPVTTWNNDGKHLLPLMYFLDTLEGGTRYEWEVRLLLSGGTATIDQENIHAFLQGQGLVAVEAWDGFVECEDEYTPIALHDTLTTSLSDTAVVSFITPMSDTVSDTYTPIALHDSLTTSLSDNVSILFVREEFYIGSEDGEYILGSEDDNYIIRNEE